MPPEPASGAAWARARTEREAPADAPLRRPSPVRDGPALPISRFVRDHRLRHSTRMWRSLRASERRGRTGGTRSPAPGRSGTIPRGCRRSPAVPRKQRRTSRKACWRRALRRCRVRRRLRAASDPDALRDDQWERLRGLIPDGRAGQRGPRCDNRCFVNALLWMACSGGRWRDLPERLGDHRAVKRRYYRWIQRGALDGHCQVERQ